MKKMVTNEQIQKIINAHESVLGTTNYNKYLMCMEYKYKKNDNKWTPWKFVAWTVPMTGNRTDYYFKTVKDKLYIMINYADEVERYEITPAVKELLGI